ncbi:hypothetical protein [Spiroplasma endosymbiont of Eupeodes luniger]|uniref:hypothetical protein n=1 Tax=Spiroplasma endosymbiont of Eupeodes luniger TaxID=3066300 RepID=UPI0030D3E034
MTSYKYLITIKKVENTDYKIAVDKLVAGDLTSGKDVTAQSVDDCFSVNLCSPPVKRFVVIPFYFRTNPQEKKQSLFNPTHLWIMKQQGVKWWKKTRKKQN